MPPARGSNMFTLPVRHGQNQGQGQTQGLPHHAQSQQPRQLPPPTQGHPGFAASGPGLFNSGFLNGGAGTSTHGLASSAAQLSFASAGQQQAATHINSHDAAKGRIREVWRHNLKSEMAVLRSLVDKYPLISMDTEFPGIVARPMGSFASKADYHYQTLRCNVDLLNMIQLGITLFNENGEVPPAHPDGVSNGYANNLLPCPCSWQFNFRFSLENDMYSEATIAMCEKAGIDFDAQERNGIDPFEFGALIISSGLVLSDDVKWISLHSGYDVGHLAKMMLCRPLPEDEGQFRRYLEVLFPKFYDVKFLLNSLKRAHIESPLSPRAAQIITNLQSKTHLAEIADEFGLLKPSLASLSNSSNQRQSHAQQQAQQQAQAYANQQTGADSLLLGQLFFKIRSVLFHGEIDDDRFLSQVWGLNGVGAPASVGAVERAVNGGGVPATPAASSAIPVGSAASGSAFASHGAFGQFYHKR